ncbi:MAG TPA: lamin tail domain-containing protein [Bacteroidales bacterium]|nr:lamin tail domain-containing protein [Bacteroidales bacterium]HOX79065.1 lamin tail domain-containing protein [Bacteroidales bacterium]HPI87487.1 lamin tail domain-containing protein [Bacteroidales bacterium]
MKKLLLSALFVLPFLSLFSQDCSDLFISEYVEGSGNNKAIELYNPTNNPINLSDYYLVRYRNGLFTPDKIQLGGTIAPKSTFVAVLDKRDPGGTGQEIMVDLALQAKADTFLCPVYDVNKMMYFNGNDAVTLEKITGDIVDIFAHIGPPMLEDDEGWGSITDTTITYNSGGVPTQYTISDYIVGPLFWLCWTSDNTLIRKSSVKNGVKTNPDVFVVTTEWDSIPENTFDSLGFHRCDCNTSGISDPALDKKVRIYPNPSLNRTITITGEDFITSIEVIDITGRLTDVIELTGRETGYTYEFGERMHGICFIRVRMEDNSVYTERIFIR